jgi:serine protease Do
MLRGHLSRRLPPLKSIRAIAATVCLVATALAVTSTPASAQTDRLWSEIPDAATHQSRIDTLPDFVDLAARLSPAVVNVATEQRNARTAVRPPNAEGGSDPFDQFGQPTEPYDSSHPTSLGSGFIVNEYGYILTNAHVVEGAQRIVVKLQDGRVFRARLIGRDTKTDIALIKIDAAGHLPIAPLGDSDTVRVGEWVIAIGNPFGFDHSVTAGIISGKGRFIPGNYDDFIQTDASINPGNSGGPLIDRRGAVVGVNTAIYTQTGSSMGIGFAVPVNLVKEELPQLRSTGKVVRGWLGVYIQPVSAVQAFAAGLGVPRGAMVAGVIDHSPAQTAGLRDGDIVIQFDHHEITEAQELPLMVGAVPVGHSGTVTVIRNHLQRDIPIVITAAREENMATVETGDTAGAVSRPKILGLTVKPVDDAMAHLLDLPPARGVIVTTVAPDSLASAAGFHARDVIIEVDQQPVKDVGGWQRAIGRAAKEKVTLILVKRHGGTIFITLRHEG